MLVFTINKNGEKLIPCKPSKARKLLRDRKDRIIKHNPFNWQFIPRL